MSGSLEDPYWITGALASELPRETSRGPVPDHADAEKSRYHFEYSVLSLKESASSGCEWCRFMLHLFDRHRGRVEVEETAIFAIELDFSKMHAVDLQLPCGLQDGEEMKFRTRLQGKGITLFSDHPFVMCTDDGKDHSIPKQDCSI